MALFDHIILSGFPTKGQTRSSVMC